MPRLYPGALVWCARKPGRDLRESVELWLAWRRVAHEVAQGVLGAEFDRADRAEVQARVKEAEEVAREEVWADYRFVALGDAQAVDGLKVIDLGAGHASGSETLCGRIIAALKSGALLSESVGAGYIDRHWPPAFENAGAWPLISLRQSFLNGALTRLLDPDTVLRRRIAEFVQNGDFGLASGDKGNGQYERVWYKEPVGEEVAFEPGVFLLTKATAERLRAPPGDHAPTVTEIVPTPVPAPVAIDPSPGDSPPKPPAPTGEKVTLRLTGAIPPEAWNRFGTKVLPKLRSADSLTIGAEFTVSVDTTQAHSLQAELRQALADLGLSDQVQLELL